MKSKTDDIVTVAKCYSIGSFDTQRAMLESNGIKVYSDSETTVTVVPWYSNALGGLRLKVSSSDQARAREILASIPKPTINAKLAHRQNRAAFVVFICSLFISTTVSLGIGLWSRSPRAGLQMFLPLTFVIFLLTAHVFIPKGE